MNHDQVMGMFIICDDKYRIYSLPKGYVLHMNSYGNEDILYCGKDGCYISFPDELYLENVDNDSIESLGDKMYKSGLYNWKEYILLWKKQRFLKISSVSKHVPYEIAKINQ